MPRPVMTRALARAAATDAGNRSMRAGGRKVWSRADYNTAVREYARLWPKRAQWVEAVLTNDEASTNGQLIEFFTANGLTASEARAAVAERNNLLKGAL